MLKVRCIVVAVLLYGFTSAGEMPSVLSMGAPTAGLLERKLGFRIVNCGGKPYWGAEYHHYLDGVRSFPKEQMEEIDRRFEERQNTYIEALDSFDVVMAGPGLPEPVAEKIRKFVEDGGSLIWTSRGGDFSRSVLGQILPAPRVKRGRFGMAPLERKGHLFTFGIPLEQYDTDAWHCDGEEPFSFGTVVLTSPVPVLLRRVGKGRVLQLPFGGFRTLHTGVKFIEVFDYEEIWMRFYRQAVYLLAFGEDAFDVMVDIRTRRLNVVLSKEHARSQPYRTGALVSIPASIFSRIDGKVKLSFVLQNKYNKPLHREKRTLKLKAGALLKLEFSFRLPDELPSGVYRVVLSAHRGSQLLHQAVNWIEVQSPLRLQVMSNRRGYRPGDKVKLIARITGMKHIKRRATLILWIHDFRGRILYYAERALRVEEPGDMLELFFRWRMTDWGPRVYTFWLRGRIVEGETVRAEAHSKFYRSERWDMRNEFQWSIWCGLSWSPAWYARRVLRLFEDAGFNSLGMNSGRNQIYWAEIKGWRAYTEIGAIVGTQKPAIRSATREELRAELEGKISPRRHPWGDTSLTEYLDSPAVAIASLEEEGGFGLGWGRTFYWDETGEAKPYGKDNFVAPPEACRAFQQFLRARYRNIQELNGEWETQFNSFAEIPLLKKPLYGGEEKYRQNLSDPDPSLRFVRLMAPSFETERFYKEYYQAVCDIASELYHQSINPVSEITVSVPARSFWPRTSLGMVRAGCVLNYPKEIALYHALRERRNLGDKPAFALSWAFWDYPALQNCILWMTLVTGVTHHSFWFDIPLMFNRDLTHTRASLSLKRFVMMMNLKEKLLLDKRAVSSTELGVYEAPQVNSEGLTGRFHSALGNPMPIVLSALVESGYTPTMVEPDQFGKCRILFAPYAQIITEQTGRALEQFVRQGGTLVTTPWFSSYTPHGNPLTVYPEGRMARLLGFKLRRTSEKKRGASFEIPSGTLGRQELELSSNGWDEVLGIEDDVRIMARYPDRTPALLLHPYGSGKVIHCNFIYEWEHHWLTFYTRGREAYRRFYEALVEWAGGARRLYKIILLSTDDAGQVSRRDRRGRIVEGWTKAPEFTSGAPWHGRLPRPRSGDGNPYWLSQLYTCPKGVIYYLLIVSDYRAPHIKAKLLWNGEQRVVYDVISSRQLPLKEKGDERYIVLTLRPGNGKFLAFLPYPVGTISLQVHPRRIRPGDDLHLRVRLLDTDGRTVDGAHSMNLMISAERGKLLYKRGLTVRGSLDFTLRTALTDRTGKWTVTVQDCVTGTAAGATVMVRGSGGRLGALPVSPPDWWSQKMPDLSMAEDEFITALDQLTEIYLRGGDKLTLCAHYFGFGERTRHHLLRRLWQIDWRRFVPAMRRALRRGRLFILTGEDLGTDPLSGLRVYPFFDAHQHGALRDLTRGAPRHRLSPTMLLYRIGRGRLIIDSISIDAQGWTNREIKAWHEGWLKLIRQTE